jgi:ABC-type nitrate/sulfonate/bicarbonate transport system substrate-binding protein
VERVTVAMSLTPLSTPFIIAEANGYFAKEGVDVIIRDYQGGHRTIQALFSGEADVATASEVVVMFNSLKRADFAILATFVTSDNDVKLLACKGSGIRTVQDLEGKRVGAVIGAAAHFFLSYTLLVNGVPEERVRVVDITPEESPSLCSKGDVDAFAIWEPYPYLSKAALGDGVAEVNHHRDYIETFNAIVMRDFHDRHGDALERLLRALIRAADFIRERPEASQKLVADRLGKEVAVIRAMWGDFDFTVAQHQWLLSSLEAEARWAIRNGLGGEGDRGRRPPNYLDFLITGPMKRVRPEAMTVIE